MAEATDDDNYAYDTVMANILEVCKNGCTEQKMIDETGLYHDQLRRITAELVDKELPHYNEYR